MFTRKKFLVLSLVVLGLLFSSFTIPLAYAFSYQEIDIPDTTNLTSPLNYQILQHSSGKFLYFTTNNLYTFYGWVYSSTGTLEGTFEYTLDTNEIGGLALYDYDETYALLGISTIDKRAGGDFYIEAVWVKLNLVTYGFNVYTGDSFVFSNAGAEFEAGISEIYEYEGDYYFIGSASMGGYSGLYQSRFYISKFVFSTSTVTVYTTTKTTTPPYITSWYGFQDTGTDDNKVYCFTGHLTDTEKPTYYLVDLDSHTFSTLASQPLSDRMAKTRYMNFLGGGKEIDGEDIWLYFTWVFPYLSANSRRYKIIQHRLVFNQTIISTELKAQSERLVLYTTGYGYETTLSFIVGDIDDKDSLTVWLAEMGYEYPTTFDYPNKLECSISDWFNYASGGITVDSYTDDTDNFPFISETDLIGRIFTSTFQANEYDGDCYIFYDLTPLSREYELTVLYTPSDNPLIQDKPYTFTVFTEMNGFAYDTAIVVYWDSVQIRSDLTGLPSNPTGYLDFPIQNHILGSHNITINVYDGSELVLSESQTYLFVSTDEDLPTSSDFLSTTIGQILTALPILLLVVLPTVSLGSVLGGIGYITGLIIGVVIAVQSGYIPFWAVFLLGLSIILAFLYLTKNGFGNNNKEIG